MKLALAVLILTGSLSMMCQSTVEFGGVYGQQKCYGAKNDNNPSDRTRNMFKTSDLNGLYIGFEKEVGDRMLRLQFIRAKGIIEYDLSYISSSKGNGANHGSYN